MTIEQLIGAWELRSLSMPKAWMANASIPISNCQTASSVSRRHPFCT
jgi:hypothetical protein